MKFYTRKCREHKFSLATLGKSGGSADWPYLYLAEGVLFVVDEKIAALLPVAADAVLSQPPQCGRKATELRVHESPRLGHQRGRRRLLIRFRGLYAIAVRHGCEALVDEAEQR